MFKIERAVSKILKSTSNIKALAVSSIKAIDKYLNSSKDQGYENVSQEFIFKKNLSEFDVFKATNSFSDFGMIQKEGTIDWTAVRKLIYARFVDEIRENKIIAIKSEAVKGISEEFKDLRSQGYDFKKVANLIEQKKAAVSNKYELEVGSNVSSSSLIARMKELSISGYISRYAGEQGLRQDIEEVMHKKALVIEEFMATITSRIEDPEEYSSELLG